MNNQSNITTSNIDSHQMLGSKDQSPKLLKYYILILVVMKITLKESWTSLDKIERIDNLNHVVLGFPILIPHCLKPNWFNYTKF